MNQNREAKGQVMLSAMLLLVLGGLIVAGIFMLDQLGFVDVNERLHTLLEPIPYLQEYVAPSPISETEYRLDRLYKMESHLDEREKKLARRREQLDRKAEKLRQERQRLERVEKELSHRETALLDRKERFQKEEKRYEYLANLYSNMPPAEAARRLSSIESDRVVIAILRRMKSRNGSVILSKMPADRAALVTRKLAHFPENVQ